MSDTASIPPVLHEERIQHEQARRIIATSYTAAIGFLVTATSLAIFLFVYIQNSLVIWWLVFVYLLQGGRCFFTYRYFQAPEHERDKQFWIDRYVYVVMLSGISLGLAFWLFLPQLDTALSFGLMAVTLIVCSSGVLSVMHYKPTIFTFVLAMDLTPMSALLWQGQTFTTFLALGVLIHLLSTLKFAFKQNAILTDALRIRFENERLLVLLAEQVRLVELASKDKTRFFAAASHDLRQPLHSLGLFGASLLTRLKATPDETLARNMMHCIDVLETSFSAMLDVSKLDSGVVEPKPQAVALSKVFSQLHASFARHAQSQGLDLRFKAGGKWVMTDPALLERLLGNLIHNALKFTATGGILIVGRTRYIKGQAVMSLEVWDTGVGMAEDELPHIFEEFYQVGNHERDRAKGLGIGLAIVKRLGDLLAHPVSAQSRQGRGSVFKLLVPAAQAKLNHASNSALPAATSSDLRRWQGLRVLVVDDEEGVRSSTAVALRLYGVHVELADGYAQAKERVAAMQRDNIRLDAMITDFRLHAHEDGIALVTTLRLMLKRDVPALLVTGDTAPERVRQAQQSGLRVLYKPVKISVLLDELSNITLSELGGSVTRDEW
jgi:signal transduction histidine kinase/ActR/RegA family two-component response regulator